MLVFKAAPRRLSFALASERANPTTTMNQNKNPNRLKPLRASKPTQELFQLPPLGMDEEALALDVRRYFGNFLGRDKYCRSSHYPYQSLVLALRDRLMERWKHTRYAYEEEGAKHAYYLSLEFLMGRTLNNALLNLGLGEVAEAVLRRLGLELEELIDNEHDAGLGNGGLGRLAACFLDSCATLQLPVMGYGIRYEYGMFRQRDRGRPPGRGARSLAARGQPLGAGTARAYPPHPVRRPHRVLPGRQRHCPGRAGSTRKDVLAMPYDMPVPGYRNDTVNTLRLWSAAATDDFDLGEFNAGDYTESVAAKNAAENITMVLYPNDASENGKELRLHQEYFLVSASLQDVLARWKLQHGNDFSQLRREELFPAQRHPPGARGRRADAHPARRARPGVGRGLGHHRADLRLHQPHPAARGAGEVAGRPLRRTSCRAMLQIIYEINRRFLREVRAASRATTNGCARMSLIEEGDGQQVRMANLAIVGSHSVNGVAALHSELLKQQAVPRLLRAVPGASSTTRPTASPSAAGCCRPTPAWRGSSPRPSATAGSTTSTELAKLAAAWPTTPPSGQRWHAVKRANKATLAELVAARATASSVDTGLASSTCRSSASTSTSGSSSTSCTSCTCTTALKADPDCDMVPRTFIFGGKAAPGYRMAKRSSSWSTRSADMINADPAARRPAQGGLPAELPRLAWPSSIIPGRRPLRADLHRRQGGLRAPAT